MMPAAHVEADVLILEGIRALARNGRRTYSINDFGAGVGQYGHYLRREGLPWHGYDGAGDVEEYTDGFVKFVDLSLPTLALPRADWVVSLEVAEHIPRTHEWAVLRNLHAHACRERCQASNPCRLRMPVDPPLASS